jgi:hypothetical protein
VAENDARAVIKELNEDYCLRTGRGGASPKNAYRGMVMACKSVIGIEEPYLIDDTWKNSLHFVDGSQGCVTSTPETEDEEKPKGARAVNAAIKGGRETEKRVEEHVAHNANNALLQTICGE